MPLKQQTNKTKETYALLGTENNFQLIYLKC